MSCTADGSEIVMLIIQVLVEPVMTVTPPRNVKRSTAPATLLAVAWLTLAATHGQSIWHRLVPEQLKVLAVHLHYVGSIPPDPNIPFFFHGADRWM